MTSSFSTVEDISYFLVKEDFGPVLGLYQRKLEYPLQCFLICLAEILVMRAFFQGQWQQEKICLLTSSSTHVPGVY